MLPAALENLFDGHAQPRIRLCLAYYNSAEAGILGTYDAPGDVGEFVKRIILDIDKMAMQAPGDDEFSPRDLSSWDNSYVVEAFLLRDDDEDFRLWQRPIKDGAITPLFLYLKGLKNPTPQHIITLPLQSKKPQHWSKRFGKLLARLGCDLDGTVREEVSNTSVDLINDYASGGYEQTRTLLPIALKKLLNEPESISITIGRGKKQRTFCRIKEGDVYDNLETLLLGLNEICKPYDLTELNDLTNEERKKQLSISINLEEQELEPVTVHRQAFPREALRVLEQFINKAFLKKEPTPEDENSSFSLALSKIAADPDTPQHIGVQLTEIAIQIGKNEKPRNLGKMLASLIEDEEIPDIVRKSLAEAATSIMNDLKKVSR